MAASPTTRIVPADEAARKRIRTELDSNLCVEAGAGTGKTTVLVSRIRELLRTGRVTIDEIAVITFTEKAAAELAARVRDELEEALRECPETDVEQRERLRQALLGLHRARIETIHAFAANILRERPIEARLDPNFDVQEGIAAGLAFEEAYSQWIEKLFGSEGPAADKLRRVLNRGFDEKQVRAAVDALHDHRYALPLDDYPPVPEASPDRFMGEVERIVGELEAVAGRATDQEDALVTQLPVAQEYRDELRAVRSDRERFERALLESYPTINIGCGRGASWNDPDDCKLMKGTVKELRELIKVTQRAVKAEALADFLPLAESFVVDYTTQRRAEGHADYDDLLLWARDLLKDNLEVRAYFQRRFECVLVDEFQDTDPTQAELVMYICSDVSGTEGELAAREREWYELPLRSGALFVVGDPKQSIYRFRRADMGVYDRIKNGPLRDGIVELSQSFRSLPGLIDWFNNAFDRIFVEKPGVQPPNIPLVATSSELQLDRSPVVVVHGQEPVRNVSDLRKKEAQLLATLISRAVEEEHWRVRDPATGEERAAEFRDVAVLVPKRTEIDAYEDAFDEGGLPYRHEGNRTFYQRQEVREMAACLRAIDDPTDKLSLVTALRSSAFACSDEELFLFTADGGWLDYLSTPPDGHEAVAGALANLKELHFDRKRTGLPELVHRLVSRTHWAELALTIPQGEQAAGNLLKVVDQARAFAGAGGGGLRTFARWLVTGRDPAAADEAEASVMEETDDVIRLMTIHNAKGLEFPIVALANFNSDPSKEQTTFLERESNQLNVTTWVGSFKTPGYEEAWEHEKEHSKAEDLRTLYVACTRARDHLIVPVIPRANGDTRGLTEALMPFLAERDDCFLYDPATLLVSSVLGNGRASQPTEAQIKTQLKRREGWKGERDAVLLKASQGSEVVSASAGTEFREQQSSERRDDTPRIWAARGVAATLGNALHKVMELVDLENATNLEPLTQAVCLDLGVTERAREVLEMARNCLGSTAVKRAIKSEFYAREVAFGLDSGARSGRVDLLFREKDTLVIVDYKTERVTESELDERVVSYAGQVSSYYAAASLGDATLARQVVLIFARVGQERCLSQ